MDYVELTKEEKHKRHIKELEEKLDEAGKVYLDVLIAFFVVVALCLVAIIFVSKGKGRITQLEQQLTECSQKVKL